MLKLLRYKRSDILVGRIKLVFTVIGISVAQKSGLVHLEIATTGVFDFDFGEIHLEYPGIHDISNIVILSIQSGSLERFKVLNRYNYNERENI